MKAVNLGEKLASFSEYWSPKIVGEFNGHDIMVVKANGVIVIIGSARVLIAGNEA